MLRTLLAVTTSLCLVTPSIAQDQQPPLVQAINKASWNTATRGPLLVVIPETWFYKVDPEPSGGITDIAAYFQRKLIKAGAISALVPTQMTVLNIKPGQPDPRKLPASLAIQKLLQSLSDAQWKLLGTDGLGKSDLNAQQSIYLDSAFAMYSGGYFYTGRPSSLNPLAPERELLPEGFFRSAKIKMSARPCLTLPLLVGGKPETVDFLDATIDRSASKMRIERNGSSPAGQRIQSGIALNSQVLEKAKPGDLDFGSFTQLVSLLPGKTSIKAVIAAIAQATGLEIYADKRLEDKAVWLWAEKGQTLQSGDVLRALARSVTGTYRRVDDIYVLTDDRDGLGSKLTELLIWQRAQQRSLGDSIPWKKWLPYAQIETIKGLPFTADQKEKIRNGDDFPSSVIPNEWIQARVSSEDSNNALDANRKIQVYLRPGFTLEIPGTGSVDIGVPARLSRRALVSADPLAPKTVRLLQGDSFLFVAKTKEEAEQAIDIIADRKIQTLYLNMPSTDAADLEMARAAGKAAKEKGVSLKLVLPLLRDAEAAESLKDINILGQTGPWLNVLLPESAQRATTRLKPFFELPGVSEVTLKSFRAPGYSEMFGAPGLEIPQDYSNEFVEFADYGFSLKNRKALLRQFHIDPIDIGPTEMGQWVPPLFSWHDNDPCLKWRADQATQALKNLAKSFPGKIGWLGEPTMPGRLTRKLYESSPTLEESFDPVTLPAGSAARFAHWLTERNPRTEPWLIDFTYVPVAQWKPMLQGVIGP